MDAEDWEVFHGRVDRSWLWTRVWVRGRKSRWGGMLQAQEPGGSWKPFQWTVKVQSIPGDSTGPRETHGAYVANNSRQYGTPSLRWYKTWVGSFRAGEWESAPPGRVQEGLLQGEVTLSQACYHHARYLNYLFTVYQASFQTPACVMPTLSCDVSTVTVSALQVGKLRLSKVKWLVQGHLALWAAPAYWRMGRVRVNKDLIDQSKISPLLFLYYYKHSCCLTEQKETVAFLPLFLDLMMSLPYKGPEGFIFDESIGETHWQNAIKQKQQKANDLKVFFSQDRIHLRLKPFASFSFPF